MHIKHKNGPISALFSFDKEMWDQRDNNNNNSNNNNNNNNRLYLQRVKIIHKYLNTHI